MQNQLNLGFWSASRIKLIRQTEIAECGLASLVMIANYHGLNIDLGAMRRRFATSLRGATLKSLIRLADRIGFSSRAVKLPIEQIANLRMPAVLHWDLNHYVVLEKVKNGKALIHNPATSSRWYTAAELSDHFTGIALELNPANDFIASDQREKLKISQLWQNISGIKRAVFQTLILTIVLQAFVLVSPYYMQLAIDRVLPAQDIDLLKVLAIGFALFLAINIVSTFLRSFVLLWAGSSLGFGLAINIARRLFRLPTEWFEKRHVGDILSRFQSIGPIQDLLVTGAIAALIDGIMAFFIIVIMFYYSALLALVAIIAFGLYLSVRIVSYKFERDAIEETIITSAVEQSNLIETLNGITTLRLFNRESIRHAFWQNKLTDSVNANVGRARIAIWQSTASGLIFGIENIVTIYLAITLILSDGFSIGMIFAYMAYKTQFSNKGSNLIDQFIQFRMLGLHLERLSDIALCSEDISFGISAEAETELNGTIELKDITYRYSPSDPMVLNGINLIVLQGEHVAITGPSGGGKSTLVKVLLGLVLPTSGDMLVDGLPLDGFGYKSYHDQVGAVLQNDVLFAGSLAENIALFDDNPDMDLIVESAKAAAIDYDISKMPMQYETLVGDMGSALSGGQKQRVLLARALYRKPKLLIVDEGTSHLDSKHERAVNDAIRQLGITRIIIAHRKETVEAADRIIFLKDGVVHDNG